MGTDMHTHPQIILERKKNKTKKTEVLNSFILIEPGSLSSLYSLTLKNDGEKKKKEKKSYVYTYN